MIDFRIERGWSFDGYQGWVLDYRGDKGFIAKPIEFEWVELNPTATLPEPTFRMNGPLAREFLDATRKALAGFTHFDSKEDYEASRRIEKAMQAHIDSLKLVVDRALK